MMNNPYQLALLAVAAITCASAIPLQDFYPFGNSSGDSIIGRTLDGSSSSITLSRAFPFFGTDHFVLFVNNNGHISFESAFSEYTPTRSPPSVPLIAPFWADADTQPANGGVVWYRETTSQADRDRAQREIRAIFPEARRFTPRVIFIATWDHIGYYNRQTDKTNTFQCILVSDGFMSYVIFLYADDLIQWTTGEGGTGGFGGTPALVGVSDRTKYNSIHEYSLTAQVINIAQSRVPADRVMVDGMLVYRVDGESRIRNCVDSSDAELVVTRRLGHQLGGTPVLVRGLCLEPGFIGCTFDGRSGQGRFVDEGTALCITPIMSTQGTVRVALTSARSGARRVTASGTFITVPSVRAYQVAFSKDGNSDEMQLYLKAGDTVKLTWLPDEVLPAFLTSDNGFRLNIQMFQQSDDRAITRSRTNDWIPINGTLFSDIENSGSFDFVVTRGITMASCLRQNYLCPVVFRVSVVPGTRVNVSDTIQVALEGSRTPDAGIWSAVAYLQSDDADQAKLSQLCEDWADPPADDSRRNNIAESRLRRLPACPPTQRLAALDPMFRQELMASALSRIIDSNYENHFKRFFTPSASTCYLQVAMGASSSGASHHCCYGSNGALVTGQPAGGSVDAMSPMVDFNTHNLNDLLPYAICCRGGLRCDRYNDLRPSRYANEPTYVLPIPACVYGDPHIVTLDGHKYTFNGKGEFTLVETPDNSFTLQGRMEQPLDASNNTVPGTVFTVIVARQSLGGVNRTVEFQVNQQKGLDILVDGTTVDFSDLSEQDFQQVVVIDAGNNSGIAEFSGGSNIEIRVENGIISVMLVTLPIQYRGLTRGLMGNYNNKTLDDFIKKGSTAAMPLDSSNEEIFEFGNTWILVEPSESLFAYNREGESFGAFSDSSFTPAFEPEFENPELEQRAKELCGKDQSCLFDVAATRNENIGMATMMGVMDFEEIVDLAEPIVCTPACGEGVCVATNSCACAVGYTGERCTQRILSACELEMCQNNGTCVQHVKSFTCTCPEGFIGIFCQEKEPPLSLKLINSSPRTFRNITFLDFIPSKPLKSARCILNNSETDCTSGRVRFNNLSPGHYSLLINATAITDEEAILRRSIFVCAANSGSCGVNLINEGVSVTGDCVLFQFTACGPVQTYSCSLDSETFKQCLSPLRYCGLAQGQHRLRVQPAGEECEDIGGLTTQFHII